MIRITVGRMPGCCEQMAIICEPASGHWMPPAIAHDQFRAPSSIESAYSPIAVSWTVDPTLPKRMSNAGPELSFSLASAERPNISTQPRMHSAEAAATFERVSIFHDSRRGIPSFSLQIIFGESHKADIRVAYFYAGFRGKECLDEGPHHSRI